MYGYMDSFSQRMMFIHQMVLKIVQNLLSYGHTGLTGEKRLKNNFICSCSVVFVSGPFLIR